MFLLFYAVWAYRTLLYLVRIVRVNIGELKHPTRILSNLDSLNPYLNPLNPANPNPETKPRFRVVS